MLKILTLLLLSSLSAYSADKTATSKTETIDSQSTNTELNTILKIPKVAEKYDECKKYYAKSNSTEVNYSDCIWNGIPAQNGLSAIEGIDDKTKTLVQDELKKTQKTTDDKLDLTLESSNISSTYKGHPGYQKLYDIVGQRIHEALGYSVTTDKKKIVAVDHSTFNGLYKAEISKGIVDSLSNYCMKVDYTKEIVNTSCLKECEATKDILNKEKDCSSFCTFYSYKASDEKKNSTNVLNAINNGQESYTTEDGQVVNIKLAKCMASISAACSNTASGSYDPDRGNANAKKLACVTNDYLTSARKNLLLNDKISKVYDEQMVSKSNSLEISNLQKEASINKESTITVTSSEVEKAYKKTNEDLAEVAKKCAENPDMPDCKNLLDTNRSEKTESVTEYGLRQYAQEKNLTTELNNKDTLTTYLKGEGYTDQQIQELLKDDTKVSEVKNYILDKYRAKKDAIISELSDRVNNTTSKSDGSITRDDVSKFDTLSTNLIKKTDDLKNLTRFNNIASAYLTVESSDDKKRSPASEKANTVSLQAEIKDTKTNSESNEKLKQAFKSKLDNSNTSNDTLNIFKTLQDILGI